jgi:hypothetical protein
MTGAAVPMDGVREGGLSIIGEADGERDGNVIGVNVGELVPGTLVVGAIEGTKGQIVDGGSPKSLCEIKLKLENKKEIQ